MDTGANAAGVSTYDFVNVDSASSVAVDLSLTNVVDGVTVRLALTVIATRATPDDERDYGVEDGGGRSRNILAARPRKLT